MFEYITKGLDQLGDDLHSPENEPGCTTVALTVVFGFVLFALYYMFLYYSVTGVFIE